MQAAGRLMTLVVTGILLGAGAGQAQAPNTGGDTPRPPELQQQLALQRQQIELLQKQVGTLAAQVQQQQTPVPQKPVRIRIKSVQQAPVQQPPVQQAPVQQVAVQQPPGQPLDDAPAVDKSTTPPNPANQGNVPPQPGAGGPTSTAIADFLRANPGAGMPPGVQTGFEAGAGFFIRSPPTPAYVKWNDESRIPFELRVRGRAQLDYYFYKSTDNLNHLTGQRYAPEVGDFSQLEVKRLRLIFEGNLFTPNLRYQFQLDGNTRGLGGFQGNRVIQNTGTPPEAAGGAPGLGGAASSIGGGDVVDHAVRLFTCWVAYDIPLGGSNGCGSDCPDGTYRYTPVLTFIVGKQQPFFGFTEILGSANAQFVDFAMADWFFDADDNNMLTAAAAQLRAFDDRLFATAMITNGNESQFPNTQMDRLPGFIGGFWYDLGGTWNDQAKRWDLYGASASDLDYSVNPVVRVGGACNLVPMDRRSIYGDIEQSRVFVTPGGPNGTRLINLLNGDAGTPLGSHSVDKFNSYTFDAWASVHYRGFSLTNEWWYRTLNGFQTPRSGNNQIVYQDGTGANSLFPTGRALTDYGTLIQGGYFVVPKKLELVARFDMISGNSGDINGNGTFRTTRVNGFTNPVRVINGAFTHFHQASEIAFGFNYYFYGQLVKWSTDFDIYQGGNPAAGSTSPAGYTAGVDGWMVRTQLQVAF